MSCRASLLHYLKGKKNTSAQSEILNEIRKANEIAAEELKYIKSAEAALKENEEKDRRAREEQIAIEKERNEILKDLAYQTKDFQNKLFQLLDK